MPDTRDCCLCSQIDGRARGDQIAALLGERPYVRRVMAESDALAAIPSLGPLSFGHALLCPRDHIRSLTALPPERDGEVRAMTSMLRRRLCALYGAAVHIFEHGMAPDGIRTVCTVDHAHLHLVPLPSWCVSIDEIDKDERWVRFDGSLEALRRLTVESEYIAYESPVGDARVLVAEPGGLESQYMRKVLARVLERPARWDWRLEPDAVAADASWRRFVHL